MKLNAHTISKTAAIACMLIGLAVIAGWIFDLPAIKTAFSGDNSMKFNTAVCFVLSGIALYLFDDTGISKRKKTIALVCVWLVMFTGLVTLTEYFTNTNFGIDELLWKEGPVAEDANAPGRMGFFTAVNFSLLAFVISVLRNKKFHLFIQVVLVIIFTLALLVIFNHLAGVDFLETVPSRLSATALHTAGAFIILCVGIFFSSPLGYLKFSFQKKIAAFFGLVIFLVVIIFMSIHQMNQRSITTSRLVLHTNEVLLANEKILSEAQDIETGVRGFIITNDEKFLEPYQKAVGGVNVSLNHLRDLTRDNASQQTRIDKLAKLVLKSMLLRATQIDLRKNSGFEAAMQNVQKGEGRIIMDSIRLVSASVQQEEERLQAIRKAENQQVIDNSSRFIMVFQVVAGLILIATFVIIYNNTQKRNRAEAALRKSEEFIKAIINNTSNPISIRDTSGKYLLVNKSVARTLKRSEKDLIGKDYYEVLPKENADASKAEDEKTIRTKSITVAETSIGLNGDIHYFTTNRFPLLDEEDNVYAVGSVSTDITAIKRAEEKLKEFKHFFNNSNDFSCIANTQGYFEIINPNFEKMLGYSEKELLETQFLQFIHPDDIPATLQEIEKLKAGARTINFVNRYRKKDGSYLWFDWNTTPDPVTGKLYAIARDITERKILEDKLKQFNRELEQKVEQRTEELSKKAGELKASNTELERFAYVASHDLQEPLRMVSSFLNLLEEEMDGQLTDTSKEYIHYAVDGAGRMKVLVNDLLQYSRVGTNKEDFAQTDINEVMSYVKRVLEEEIEKNHAVITVSTLPVITANKTLINQLFVNLVSNALKYHCADKAPVIEIGCTESGDDYTFFVKDNGIGIEPKYFDKIFIIFQRLHNKNEYSGTGIGLAICKKVVDLHKGKIWVESEQGRGSTFYFTISKKIKHDRGN